MRTAIALLRIARARYALDRLFPQYLGREFEKAMKEAVDDMDLADVPTVQRLVMKTIKGGSRSPTLTAARVSRQQR